MSPHPRTLSDAPAFSNGCELACFGASSIKLLHKVGARISPERGLAILTSTYT